MRRDERGLAISVEAAVVLPVIVLFLGLLLTLGRVVLAEQHVGAAASAAARAASLERTVGAARAAADSAAVAMLGQRNLSCRSTAISADVSGLAKPVGTPAEVSAAVTCVVELADVAVPFMPGSITVSAERFSPVDPYRGR